jgi:DNA-binding MarR family transcriptional regulator
VVGTGSSFQTILKRPLDAGTSRADTAGVTAALTKAQDQFIAVWGQMAGAWGISRTMAEVHALLFIVGEPMCTDDVMERLQISRGNASMSLRGLLDWSIIERSHKRGDRKEYFAAEHRARRGEGAEADRARIEAHNRRIDEMLEFFRVLEKLGHRFVSPSGRGLQLAAMLLGRLPEGAGEAR